jgi:hypothetical protein
MSRPRWIIDDTAKPGTIFCEHTQEPELLGKLLTPDQLPKKGFAMPAPGGRCLYIVRFLGDSHVWDEQDMYDSLTEALEAHQAAKVQAPSKAVG